MYNRKVFKVVILLNITTMELKSFKINKGTWDKLIKIYPPLEFETLNCYFNRLAEALEEGKLNFMYKHSE